MDNLKQELITEANSISSVHPWLVAIRIIKTRPDEDLGGYEFIVADNQDFEWIDEDNNITVFKKFPFSISSLPLQSDGKIPSVTLSLFNTATLARFMEDKRCFIGYDIILYFINSRAIAKYDQDGNRYEFLYNMSDYPIKFPLVVKDGSISNKITLTLGGPSYLTVPIPAQQYYRDFCRFSYRSEFCFMKVVDKSLLEEDPDNDIDDTVCNKSYENCCMLYEKYKNHLNIQHPLQGVGYGGFPMLAKGSFHLA
jgi:phage-related protein